MKTIGKNMILMVKIGIKWVDLIQVCLIISMPMIYSNNFLEGKTHLKNSLVIMMIFLNKVLVEKNLKIRNQIKNHLKKEVLLLILI